MNLSQILNYAKENNCNIETNFPQSYIDPTMMRIKKYESISKHHVRFDWDIKTQDETHVGIQIKTRWSTMYYWFTCYNNESHPDSFHPAHIYNQNTGQTIRSYNKAFKLMDKIENFKK